MRSFLNKLAEEENKNRGLHRFVAAAGTAGTIVGARSAASNYVAARKLKDMNLSLTKTYGRAYKTLKGSMFPDAADTAKEGIRGCGRDYRQNISDMARYKKSVRNRLLGGTALTLGATLATKYLQNKKRKYEE